MPLAQQLKQRAFVFHAKRSHRLHEHDVPHVGTPWTALGFRVLDKALRRSLLVALLSVVVITVVVIPVALFFSVALVSVDPLSVDPLSVAPLSVAPLSVAPLSVAPLSVAPLFVTIALHHFGDAGVRIFRPIVLLVGGRLSVVTSTALGSIRPFLDVIIVCALGAASIVAVNDNCATRRRSGFCRACGSRYTCCCCCRGHRSLRLTIGTR